MYLTHNVIRNDIHIFDYNKKHTPKPKMYGLTLLLKTTFFSYLKGLFAPHGIDLKFPQFWLKLP